VGTHHCWREAMWMAITIEDQWRLSFGRSDTGEKQFLVEKQILERFAQACNSTG